MPLVFTNANVDTANRIKKIIEHCLHEYSINFTRIDKDTVELTVVRTNSNPNITTTEKAIVKWINIVANHPKTTSIRIATSPDERKVTEFGHFRKMLLDVKDIESLGPGYELYACAFLIHEIVEQYNKQVIRFQKNTLREYYLGHKLGRTAETEILGAKRRYDAVSWDPITHDPTITLCWESLTTKKIHCLAFKLIDGNPVGPPTPVAIPPKDSISSRYFMNQLTKLESIATSKIAVDYIDFIQTIHTIEQMTNIKANTFETYVGRHYSDWEILTKDIKMWREWFEKYGHIVKIDFSTWEFEVDYSLIEE